MWIVVAWEVEPEMTRHEHSWLHRSYMYEAFTFSRTANRLTATDTNRETITEDKVTVPLSTSFTEMRASR